MALEAQNVDLETKVQQQVGFLSLGFVFAVIGFKQSEYFSVETSLSRNYNKANKPMNSRTFYRHLVERLMPQIHLCVLACTGSILTNSWGCPNIFVHVTRPQVWQRNNFLIIIWISRSLPRIHFYPHCGDRRLTLHLPWSSILFQGNQLQRHK